MYQFQKQERQLLFHIIADVMNKSVIRTSNLEIWSMDSHIGDNGLLSALVDRLVQSCPIIDLTGESYRLSMLIFWKY